MSAIPETVVDIAIVGGGVAGAYTAYRLLSDDADRSSVLRQLRSSSGRDRLEVCLLEASDRVGGRLWSYEFPHLPNTPAELGGRCLSQMQRHVYGLCTQELNLETVPCPCYETLPNVHYFRQHRWGFYDYFQPRSDAESDKENHYPRVIPYFLQEEEKWQHPYYLVLNSLFRAIPELQAGITQIQTAVNDRDWAAAIDVWQALTLQLRAARTQDSLSQPLYDTGIWNFLARYLSPDAYRLATADIGVCPASSNWNLYDAAIGLMDFAIRSPFFRLKNGYDRLPKTLLERFQARGGRVYMQAPVQGLQLSQDETIALTVKSASGEEAILRARYAILALPKHALLQLDRESLMFQNPQFEDNLRAVGTTPARTLSLSYDRPWWQAFDIQSGSSFSDLPLRQCYYVGTETDGTSSLQMLIADAPYSQFWDAYLRSPQLRDWVPYPGKHATPEALQASSQMVREAQRQLRELHGANDIPEPSDAVFWDWNAPPYGGGWHFWHPQYRSWEIIPLMRQPIPGRNVFVCGEAYSARQGWVEGALNSAERVLADGFHLPRPQWLEANYDFGP